MDESRLLLLATLHRYWLTADSILERMRLDIPHKPGPGIEKFPADLLEIGQWHSRLLTLSVFYGLLFVVVEGYQELKLIDDTLDALLAEGEYVALLKRFRNGVFHFQKDPFDDRLLEFLVEEGSETWTKKLHAAFNRFFVRQLPIQEQLECLTNDFHDMSSG